MEIDKNQSTQGSLTQGEFIPVGQNANEQRKSQAKIDDAYSNSGENDRFGIKHIPVLLKWLEENFQFTAILIGIVGYIIISSFGHMDSFSKYLGYTIFLVVNFALYKFLGANSINIEYDLKNANKVLMFVSLSLALLFLVEHKIFTLAYNYFINFTSTYIKR